VFLEPSTTIKSRSLVAVAAVAVSFWGAARQRWHVPRCSGAVGTLLSNDATVWWGLLLSGGATGTLLSGGGGVRQRVYYP
jgi:hypothetical protein